MLVGNSPGGFGFWLEEGGSGGKVFAWYWHCIITMVWYQRGMYGLGIVWS